MANYIINIKDSQVNIRFIENSTSAGKKTIGKETEEVIFSMAEAHISQTLREQFEPKKRHNMLLADAYQASGMTNASNKAVRLATCARWLEFAIPPDGEDKRYKITKTSSCHVRLCPVCQWRRSLNTYRNLARIYAATEIKGLKHIFVTLTQKNVSGDKLAAEIKKISDAYAAMMKRKPFKNIVKGYTRTIEVTRADNGTFHPHIHAIWTVAASYGSKDYVSQKALCKAWQDALKLEYSPICDIRVIRKLDGKSVAEVAKYSVKPSDYIDGTIEGTADIIKILDPALDGKRFVSYGGIVREIKQKIFHEAAIEDIEAETISEAEWENWERVLYEWHFSEERYRKITV